MPRDSAYVAVYDVSDDRERGRVASVLEGFGLRVQWSAFEMRLTPAARQTVLHRLEALELKSGFLFLYRRAGGQDRTAVGQAPEDSLGEDRHAWVVGEASGGGEAPAVAPRRHPTAQSAPAPEPERALVGGPAGLFGNPVVPADFAVSVSEAPAASVAAPAGGG